MALATKVDALIVGGGPAGLAAGIVLSEQGLQVMLCEKQSYPIDKACGEGIMPTGVAALKRLGIYDLIDHNATHPIRGIRYIASNGEQAEAAFAEGPGLGVRRTALSQALYNRAQQCHRLSIHIGCEVGGICRQDGGFSIKLGDRQIQTSLLVGADGLHSRVRRFAGLQGSKSSLMRWGTTQHYAIKPWTDHVEIHWQNGVEAYVTPLGLEEIGIAFLWSPGNLSKGPLLTKLLDQFPKLAQKLVRATPIGPTRAIGPLHQITRAQVAHNIVLIGDAAGYLDPITGEGISLALSQAIKLAHLPSFQQSYRKLVRHYYMTTRLALLLAKFPARQSAAIQFLGRHPKIFQRLLSLNMGNCN